MTKLFTGYSNRGKIASIVACGVSITIYAVQKYNEERSERMRNFRLDDESGHQEALFEWAAYHMDCMPELEYMHHIPNGGKRDKRTAVALKRQGVKAGVPDICLPVARNGYHGLYIELKAGKNKATKNQEKWQVFLNDQGYYAVICYGWREAAKVIEEYLLKADNDKAAAVLQEMGK